MSDPVGKKIYTLLRHAINTSIQKEITMQISPERFTEVLKLVRSYTTTIGIQMVDTSELDPYFKGDLNGVSIWIAEALGDEEELFNSLHLIGHSVQWNVSKELRAMGSVFYTNPDDELLKKLQVYEWEANCYGLWVLHNLGVKDLDKWLFEKYREDMFYLTHFYKTGEKLKEITDFARSHEFIWPLEEKEVPAFTAYPNEESRNGIVVDFTNALKQN
jgi:hypothetical protein